MAVRFQASAQLLVVTQAIDINRASGYGRTTDPDLALGCNSDPVISLTLGDGTDYSDLEGPRGNMVCRHQHTSGGGPDHEHPYGL